MQATPTYDEAVAGKHPERPSLEFEGNRENEGLLGSAGNGRTTGALRNGNYHAPTVESPRQSQDSDIELPEIDGDEDETGLRRGMEEMGVEDVESQRHTQHSAWLSKSIGRITHTISSWRLPLPKVYIPRPSLSFITSRLPQLPGSPYDAKPSITIFLRLFAIFLVVGLVYAVMVSKVFGSEMMVHQFMPESIRAYVKTQVSRETIEKYLYEITYDDHLAGTKGDYFLAEWIEDKFNEAKLDAVYSETYEVYLNYPVPNGRKVAIVAPLESQWEAVLEEEASGTNLEQHQTLAFHGHARAGNVTGPLIYANYGAREDFQWLQDQGIDLAGSIALVRYYGYQPDVALKVKAAEMAGAIGCLLYSDPADDGFIRGPTYPEGPYRPADSVQRGSVSLTSWVLGDPLTPGNASTPTASRQSKDSNPGLVNIPSLPLAWRDAQVLLKALANKGIRAPENWIGGVPDTEWWTGNHASPLVNVVNIQDENERQPIRNVIGRIEGVEAREKAIFIGNHRDAWCYGSVDPGSGTAVMLEVVRVLGNLMQIGWRPRRTIYFASWDAGEYNMMGSTEHVEERLDVLRMHAVAYLNVDAAVSGSAFRAAASPLLERALLRVLERVEAPHANTTLRQIWDEAGSKVEGLSASSDYVAFQDMAGCSSIDFGFKGADSSFPYHSCYESFEYMKNILDPDLSYHATLAKVWLLLILELADEAVLGFDFPAYAREIESYVTALRSDATDMIIRAGDNVDDQMNFAPLEEAARLLTANGAEFMEWEARWHTAVMSRGMMESREMGIRRLSHNARMSNFETHLLDLPLPQENRTGGVPGREQYKHIIFGPQEWSGQEPSYFPAIRDALNAGNWRAAQEQLEIVARILHHAADKLLH